MRLSTAVILAVAVALARLVPNTGSILGEIAVGVGVALVAIGAAAVARRLLRSCLLRSFRPDRWQDHSRTDRDL